MRVETSNYHWVVKEVSVCCNNNMITWLLELQCQQTHKGYKGYVGKTDRLLEGIMSWSEKTQLTYIYSEREEERWCSMKEKIRRYFHQKGGVSNQRESRFERATRSLATFVRSHSSLRSLASQRSASLRSLHSLAPFTGLLTHFAHSLVGR